ncbi:MAG: NAD(P)-dependent oxidoreductase [Chloroflexota bacterium]
MRILLTPRLAESVAAMAREALPAGFELVVARSDEDLIALLPGCQFLMGTATKAFSPEALARMGHLKLIQLYSAGYDRIDVEAMRRLRLPVATNGGANAIGVAEHAVMLMLAVYRDLTALDARVKSGKWRGAIGESNYLELTGKTVGIVGFGMIGREVAKRLRGFETRTLYHDPYRPGAEVEQALGVSYAPLAELLAQSDVVTLHTPLLPETERLINRESLATMKPSAILINCARGGLMDSQALYEALRDGVIAGAGLDVTNPEPPPADYPLLTLPNVTVTPHIAGSSVEGWPRRIQNGYANIQRVAAGQKPLWVIPELRELVD